MDDYHVYSLNVSYSADMLLPIWLNINLYPCRSNIRSASSVIIFIYIDLQNGYSDLKQEKCLWTDEGHICRRGEIQDKLWLEMGSAEVHCQEVSHKKFLPSLESMWLSMKSVYGSGVQSLTGITYQCCLKFVTGRMAEYK